MDIPPDHIFDLQATDRDSAIREILQHLTDLGAIPDHAEESLFDAIRHRESVMTTGVGYGIAIPHATSELVSERIVAFGKSKAGIDFGSLDGKPVKMVGLMISPKSDHEHTNA